MRSRISEFDSYLLDIQNVLYQIAFRLKFNNNNLLFLTSIRGYTVDTVLEICTVC